MFRRRTDILGKWPAVLAAMVVLPTLVAPIPAWHTHGQDYECCSDHPAPSNSDGLNAHVAAELDRLCPICTLACSVSVADIDRTEHYASDTVVRSEPRVELINPWSFSFISAARAPPVFSISI